jgi:hypothetical protein
METSVPLAIIFFQRYGFMLKYNQRNHENFIPIYPCCTYVQYLQHMYRITNSEDNNTNELKASQHTRHYLINNQLTTNNLQATSYKLSTTNNFSRTMADFFNQPLNEVLPKVNPQSIEDLEEPKKPIDPNLAARLEKHVSPPKTARGSPKKYNLKIAKLDFEMDDFTMHPLDEVLPMVNTQAVEILDPPRRPITAALASRLCGRAA